MITTPDLEARLTLRNRPNRAYVMLQTWRDLLFLHWTIDAEAIQKTLPPGLTVDTFDDKAYIGIVPFFMCAIRPRFVPPVPGISWFLETNVRTYVYDENGTPGVWFYSLDANQQLAVWIARTIWRLPYFHARMHAEHLADGTIKYVTTRRADSEQARFDYRPEGKIRRAQPDTLEFFLVERYLLFAQTRSGVGQGRVYHQPYPIQDVAVPVWSDRHLLLNNFESPGRPPDHALYSPGVSVNVYAL